MNNQKGFIGIVILIIVALAVVGGGGYYVFQKQQTKVVVSTPTPESQQPEPQQTTQVDQSKKTDTTSTKKVQKAALTFEDHLSECSKYKTTFVHPFTKETMDKEILGIVAGKCDYVEQMPNGGKMECKYTESERKTLAQYYRDVAAAESVGTSVNANLGSGEQKTTYTINGKVVANPLQEAMNSGACVISGY